ncbi:MAG: 23S rRNA (pseudouridine(1915)-N(3))-methyltransferase RlmH [Pseudomonadota bacterium]
MRLSIAAVGRLKSGPEQTLITNYARRLAATGRPYALGPLEVFELDERKVRDQASQSARLLERIRPGTKAVALDERGKALNSPDLARLLERTRDAGADEMVFLIGGADGHTRDVRDRADVLLSFGAMVWPHMLARVMLSEQLYRAVSILAGTPYHRE